MSLNTFSFLSSGCAEPRQILGHNAPEAEQLEGFEAPILREEASYFDNAARECEGCPLRSSSLLLTDLPWEAPISHLLAGSQYFFPLGAQL
jgi:hypothetical protein